MAAFALHLADKIISIKRQRNKGNLGDYRNANKMENLISKKKIVTRNRGFRSFCYSYDRNL